MAIQSRTICQVALVVKDIQATLDNYVKAFAIPMPEIRTIPSSRQVPAYTHGKAGSYEDCKLAVIPFDNTTLEIVEPGESDSPWKQWLDTHGEGVQHLGFEVENRRDAYQALSQVNAKPYHYGYYPTLTYSFVDSQPALGVELNIKAKEDNKQLLDDYFQNKKDPDEATQTT